MPNEVRLFEENLKRMNAIITTKIRYLSFDFENIFLKMSFDCHLQDFFSQNVILSKKKRLLHRKAPIRNCFDLILQE